MRLAHGHILVRVAIRLARRSAVAIEVSHEINSAVRAERHRLEILAERLIPYIIVAVVVHEICRGTASEILPAYLGALIAVYVIQS